MPDLETTHLKLPYLSAAQAQKHVTHNEALRLIDTVVQLAVLDSTLAAPPEDSEDGDRYVVAASATGAWAGKDGTVATWVDGAWAFATPEDGWLAFDVAAEALLVRLGGAWTPVAAGSGAYPDSVERLGVNATPDDTNRLAVRSEAVLFSGIEEELDGTGDIRFVVNKHGDARTASLLFQSGWSGRAEVGLCGDTDFVFKVSPDGSAWIDAIRIDKDTGLPAILYDNGVSGLTATTVQDAIDEVAASGGGGGGAVVSVFGRTGAVAATAGDYTATKVDNDSSVSGATVKDALNTLSSGKQASDGDLTAVAALSGTGVAVRSAADTWVLRNIAGTASRIAIANGDGVSGNPTLDIASSYVGQTSITTLGTVGTGVWQGTAVAVGFGGTGQTSYTNGQLLIGNSTGNTLAKATLTAPAAGIGITNGAGSITFGLLNDLSALEALSSTGIAVRTGSDAWAQRTITAGVGITVTDGSGVSGNPTIASDKTDINTQTASYTGVLGDAGKTVEMNVASANNFTVPPNSSVAFATGTVLNVVQLGAGATTIVAGSGVTIRNRNGLVLGGQYAVATLYKRGTNEWVAGGDLKT
jgi:hypothetical protein